MPTQYWIEFSNRDSTMFKYLVADHNSFTQSFYHSGSTKLLYTIIAILLFLVTLLFILFYMYSTEIIHGVKVNARSRTIPYLSKNFVGREDEIQELLELVNFDYTEIRIIGIIGSPGFGKSTLAIQLGHRLIDDGVYVHHVDLAEFPSRNVELVLAEKILKSSDITVARKISFDRLLRWARERYGHTLLILDNCDNVLRIQRGQLLGAILQLVQTSTSVKVIMTSREVALQLEYYSWYKVYELSSKAAILLLEQKLFTIKMSLKEEEEIAELTGNVPLALHIVGSLLTRPDPPTPSLVIEELKQNAVSFLSPKELPASLRISASISLSYRYLDDNLKVVACFLALFPGSFAAALEISAEYLKSLSNVAGTMFPLRLGKFELRMLVDRSLLEHNERIDRYQYHRLIREFLLVVKTGDLWHKIDFDTFDHSFREYFLKQLHQHTVDFKLKYIDSLKFLDTERHNIYILLQVLINPALLSRRSLLLTVESLVHAIDVEYLLCRFTSAELADFLANTVGYLTDHILTFQARAPHKAMITTISGKQWTQKEYYQRVYIQLVMTFSDLLEKAFNEEIALNFMNKQKEIVDNLSKVTEKNGISSQAEPDPTHNPDSVPLSTKATRQAFYVTLGNRYLALGRHSDVVLCQLKIIEDVQKCNAENCTYKEIGYMYINAGSNVKAAKFLELSLENDHNNIISKASILVDLSSVYKKLRDWPWTSQKEIDTANRLFDTSNDLIKMEDQVLFYNWRTIVKVITGINQLGMNANFLEERLFSIMSTPSEDFQLQPKDALQLLYMVEQNNNYSKTILCGTLLLAPFENYYNFSTDEKLNVLKMHVATATAKLHLYYLSDGMNELENVFEILVHDQELQNHTDSAQIYKQVCYGLILRVRYLLPCYQESTVAAIRNTFMDLLVTLPKKLIYIIFVIIIPFEKEPYQKPTESHTVPTRHDSSKAVATTNSQMYELMETIVTSVGTDISHTFKSFYYENASTFYWIFNKLK